MEHEGPNADVRGTPISGAGASAQRKADRMRAKHVEAVHARHPHIGRALLAVRDEPRSVQAWAKGAEGERRLGAELDSLCRASIFALHDRRIPGSQANIDHLAVTPGGVYVIDAKWYSGRIEARDKGSFLRARPTLYVKGRDKSDLVGAMQRQVDTVRNVVGPAVPIHPVLCFIKGEWASWSKQFMIGDVFVTAWKPLRRRMTGTRPPTDDRVARVAAQLDRALPPAG